MNLGIEFSNYSEYAHNLNIKEIGQAIFEFDDEEKGILFCIAKNGPSIITNIVKTTSAYPQWHCNRWTAKRRINGTSKVMGFIPHEYLVEKEHEKRIRGHEGKIYHLTTKGMLGALTTGINLEQIYLYKNYIKFLKNQIQKEFTNKSSINIPQKIKDKYVDSLMSFFENYIKNEIYLFLIWHEAVGIKITNMKSMQRYMFEFYSKADEEFFAKFPPQVESQNKYREILRLHFLLRKTLHALDMIAHPNRSFGNEDDTIKEFVWQKIAMVGQYVWEWPYYMEKQQFSSEGDDYSPFTDFMYNTPSGISIGNTIQISDSKKINHFEYIKENLKEFGIKKDYSDIVLRYIWDKQHKKFETLESINMGRDLLR